MPIKCLLAAFLLIAAAPVSPGYVWMNVKHFPGDLVTTVDAWSAIRAESPDQSYRIAADDFELTQATRITKIVFWGAEVGDPEILGGDWYIFAGGGSGPPGALLRAGPGGAMLHEDTGLVSPTFGKVFSNTLFPTDLVLPAGHYFLAFRTLQTLDLSGPKRNNAAFTTRVAIGSSRAWWSFDVLGDGTRTGPWVPMSDFNLAPNNEWSFRIEGEQLGEIDEVRALR